MPFFHKNHTLNTKICHTIKMVTLSLLLVVMTFICVFLSVKKWNSIKDNAYSTMNKTALYINSEIDSYVSKSIMLSTNADFIKLLETTYPEGVENRIAVSNLISNFFKMVPIKSEIVIPSFVVYTDNPTLYSSKYIYDLHFIPDKKIPLLSDDDNNITQPLWRYENNSPYVFYLFIDSQKKYKNIMRVDIDTKNINSLIENAKSPEFYTTTNPENTDKNTVFQVELHNNTNLFAVIPNRIKTKIIFGYALIFLLCYLFLSILILTIVNYIMKKTTKDINIFLNNINNDTLLFHSENIAVPEYDEFKIIKDKIVSLLTSTNNLYTRLEAAEKEKHKIELELIQSKFNPHLLYNTLSALKWNIMGGSNDTTVIDLLTKYYRTIMNHNTVITLADELTLVRQYVDIMSYAQSEKYNLEIEIDPGLENFEIMKQTLQPFVENSILHGINHRENGIIKISASKKDNTVIITVYDNGNGISEEKIKELYNDTYKSVYHNYGIRNTKNRLKLFFGEENVDFSIDSIYMQYTEIKFVIKI